MILKKIRFKNFRQYYGEQELEFSIDPNKKITLIFGKNGAGKTSFFLGLNWVLYGGSEVKIDGKIVNKKAIEEAKNNGEKFVQAEVLLTFSHEGVVYQIKRSIFYDVDSEREFQENVEMKEIYPKPKEISNPLITINPILPPNVRTYFFFDGEKIDEFSKPSHDKEVKEAVYKVLGVTIIERAKAHVYEIQREYNRELMSQASGRLKELQEKYDKLLKLKEDKEEKLKELKEERKSIEIQIEEIKGRLKEIFEIQEYIKEKDKLENKLKSLEEEKERIYEDLKNAINQSFLLIANQAINDSEEFIKNEGKETGDIPNKYLIKLIEKILEEKKCICGREVDQNMRTYLVGKKIEVSKNRDKDIAEDILAEIYGSLTDLKSKKENIYSLISSKFIKKTEILDEINQLEKDIDELDQKIGTHSENGMKLQQNLNKLYEDMGIIKANISNLEEELENLKKEIEELKREIKIEERNQQKISELTKKRNLAEDTLKQLEILYEKLSKGLREEIEREGTEIFEKLIRKKEYFKKLVLSDDFILKVIDAYGDSEVKTELSAGERQVLSLSFILALAKVSRKEAPIVMDTPFGRLDPEHRQNIVQEMPYISKQLILFVTPTEMTDDLKSIIQDKIGKEYELYFDEIEKYTKIYPLGALS